MSKDILSVENITMQFGGVVAVNNLSLHIPEGQIVALIGFHLGDLEELADERPRQIP